MVDIASETSLHILRQVALLQEREVTRLLDEVARLRAENAQLRGETPGGVQQELEYLKQLLTLREGELYGRSSEKRPHTPTAETPGVATADEAPAEGTADAAPRRRGHGPAAQPALGRIDVLYTLPETARACPACGGCLTEMKGQTEDADEVFVIDRELKVRTIRRQKYRCSCNGAVVTAPAPPRLIPGGHYDASVAIETAIDKYLDHLPLERQVRRFGREGLEVTTQTLWDQHLALSKVLAPSYQALLERALAAPVLFADETRWPLLDGRSSSHWVWSLVSDEVVFYRICPGRSTKEALALLGSFTGTLMVDGYSVYAAVAREAAITVAHCWAHVRRKFFEAQPHAPDLAGFALDRIGELFAVEREVEAAPVLSAAAVVAAEHAARAALRQQRSRAIVGTLRDWAYEVKPTLLPRSGIGKAVDYMLSLWPGLTRFLQDPRVPLDNNRAERALRGPVVGRKNHYGSKSVRGTEVAATLYTLLESAMLVGVDPAAYLRRATQAALEAPGTVTLPVDLLGT